MVENGAIGVGLLLFSNGHLLTVRELKDKPVICKQAGMVSFPLETFRDEDVRPEGTIIRLLWEELGILPEQVKLWGISPRKFHLIPGREDITTLYGIGKFLGNPDQKFIPKDDDIQIEGWKTPWELLSLDNPRIEVFPIINDFLAIRLGDFKLWD